MSTTHLAGTPPNSLGNPKISKGARPVVCALLLTLTLAVHVVTVKGNPVVVADAVTDAVFSWDEIKAAADYDNMSYMDSKTLVSVAGQLEAAENYESGFVESVIKITKNLLCPKIEYVAAAGIMKINSGEIPLEQVDFTVMGAEASTHLSCFGGGAEAKVVLAGGSVSIFNLQLGFGVSTSAGIVDDSVEVKVLGLGVSVGRKNEICVFDNCFGVDLGAFW